MSRTYLRFQDVNAPLELFNSDMLLEKLREILPFWPASVATDAPSEPPFFRIAKADEDTGLFICENLLEGRAPRLLDAVNAICDMVAAMSLALPESDPRILCLHAAAVEVGSRLILFPNARRAGKSTLTAALARQGMRIFTDDFLPVRYDGEGRLVGRGNGVAPRVRLPLPDDLNADLANWVRGQSGPENAQYKYLSGVSLAHAGESAPLGAIVILDRQESGRAELTQLAPDVAMDLLLKQNFTRDRHSADILVLMTQLLESLPPVRLTYSDAGDAAERVLSKFKGWTIPVPRYAQPETLDIAKADLLAEVGQPFEAGSAYVQRARASVSRVGNALYLADPAGSGIHRLNDMSAAIWVLLEEPMQANDIVSVLAEAFPEVDRATILSDTIGFLEKLASSGLIEPAG